MAELNALLDRAAARADALAEQASEAQRTVESLRGRAGHLAQALDRHAGHARQALHGLDGRLHAAQDEIERTAADAREKMGALEAEAERASAQARTVVERVRTLVQAEADRREKTIADLDAREAEAVSAHGQALDEIERLQDALEGDVDRTEQATTELGAVVDRVRADLASSREAVDDAAGRVEDTVREQMGGLAAAAQDALARLAFNVSDSRQALSDLEAAADEQAECEIAQRMVADLRGRVARMKEALAGLAGQRGHETEERLAELADKHAELLRLHDEIRPAFDALEGLD